VRVEAGLVGRFYLSDDPVAAGQEVEEDEILGAIESMRLMNPVVSPVRGQIVGVFVEDGQPVEYGQTLYEIEPA
jgi:biotin carboxyl carrier protein